MLIKKSERITWKCSKYMQMPHIVYTVHVIVIVVCTVSQVQCTLNVNYIGDWIDNCH